MDDNASIFWEDVKKKIKSQNTTQEWVAKNSGISFNTFQGWISKGIYPRVNEALRIAVSLNTPVEYLASGAVQNGKKTNRYYLQTPAQNSGTFGVHTRSG